MKGNLKLIFSDNIIKNSIFASIFLILTQTILILILFKQFPPLIPILNSQPWGTERLFSSSIVFLLPLFLTAIFILNNSLSAIYYKKSILIARILSFNSFLFIFLGILAYIQIIFLIL
ncbi:MAG: hypothetical protein A3G66_02780 [Candidatus Levybacteria bacterium RIFCSPLOWO2_12_FULL_39_17]|nr:MAG: hypothetical protein A2689_01830 [Candidatus Levybacteria bacterium RIFCSPHIGHO2_01_FULL_38_96]OGH36093.1 MAG: hypothetical protein A3B43_00685 [Candidatus Levybacteria bacterium RIFCSPLOWO2_01_FULL_38_120]OGH48598.1 MAG: hypothetical protein A3G66_02780 [Candidatus Levybacteria bacterium RIFCSPLOWO2_12_FULL_39_17]